MIEDFYPEWDEAAALADETRWAQRQNDRKGEVNGIHPGRTTAPAYTAPDEATMDAIDEDWVNSLKDRNG